MTAKSDTPRTDVLYAESETEIDGWLLTFMRQLERELASSQAEVNRLRGALQRIANKCDTADAYLEYELDDHMVTIDHKDEKWLAKFHAYVFAISHDALEAGK